MRVKTIDLIVKSRSCDSLYIYLINKKCVNNAFFFLFYNYYFTVVVALLLTISQSYHDKTTLAVYKYLAYAGGYGFFFYHIFLSFTFFFF